MKLIKSLLVLVMLAAQPALAAGKIVFDPTNFGRNLITAAQSVKQTAQLAAQYQKQIEQWVLQVRDLKQLDPAIIQMAIDRGMLPPEVIGGNKADVIKAAGGVYASFSQTVQELGGMMNSLADLQTQSLNLSRMSVQSGKPIPDILAAQAAAAGQGRDFAAGELRRLQISLGQLAQHQKRADALAAQIPQNSGTVEALGTIAAQNHLVTDQLSSLIQVAASQATAAQAQAVDTQSDRLRSLELIKQAEERNKEVWGKK